MEAIAAARRTIASHALCLRQARALHTLRPIVLWSFRPLAAVSALMEAATGLT